MYNYRAISLLLGIYVFIGFSLPVFADDVNFSQRPVKLKLYARDLTDSASVPVSGMVIQPGYDSIRVMGQKAAHGRLFFAGEDAAGRNAVIVISHRYWQSRFAGDPAVIGHTVKLDGEPVDPASLRGYDHFLADPGRGA